MSLPFRRQPVSRPRVRAVLLSLVAGWLIVLAAPVGAQPPDPGPAVPAAGESVEDVAASDVEVLELAGTDPDGDTGDGTETDREVVLGLVAIVLLAAAIGMHALYRDRD